MDDRHESAEVPIAIAVGGAGIGDEGAAVVDIGDWRASRLMRPKSVSALPVPVEVEARSHHQGHEVALVGAVVIGVGIIDEVVPWRASVGVA
jgi:hypothetical protein